MDDTDVIERVAGLERDVKHLNEREQAQNGTLVRVEAKIDRLVYWLMGEMAAFILLIASIYMRK